MKNKEISIFSISKITTYEILMEEQLEQLETVRFRFFQRYLTTQESLKRRFIISKILGAFIFGILPIIPLLTYFKVLELVNEGTIPIELTLFAGSLLFSIFFLFQFFNFFLMAMLNTMKILSGNIFEWLETLPISRDKLKKLILLTTLRSLDIPLIVITLSFPIMILIGTQNIFIFLICIGVSLLNTILSFSILILFSERMNRILNINEIGTKKAYVIRLINLASYIVIVIGSIFLIQWALGSIDSFFVLFGRSISPTLITLILSMIPFPIAPGYFISTFISPQQIPLFIWYNIIVGFALFLILTLLVYWQSIKAIKKTTKSKFKKDKIKAKDLVRMKNLIKIKVKSSMWAHIRKDLKISTRNLKNFLSLVMPTVISFVFTLTYNSTNIGGITPFDLNFMLNLYVVIGFNIVITGMIVHGMLSMEESGASILASLPLIPREQAKAKLILMGLIQTITILAPSLMYVGRNVFFYSFLTALCALPFILLFLILMFELRVYLFSKSKHYFVIEEILPEKKIEKWLSIYLIEYLIYFILISYAFTFYLIEGITSMFLFLIGFLVTGFIIVSIIFVTNYKKFKLQKVDARIKKKKIIIDFKFIVPLLTSLLGRIKKKKIIIDFKFIVPLLTSLLGIIFLLSLPFAGWEEEIWHGCYWMFPHNWVASYNVTPIGTYGPYGDFHAGDVLSMFLPNQLLSLILILPFLICCVGVSLIGLLRSERLSPRMLRIALYLSIGATILTLINGLIPLGIFPIYQEDPIWNINLVSPPCWVTGSIRDWWVSSGTYVVLIMSLLTVLGLFYLKRVRS